MASTMMELDIFDVPRTRWTNLIGTRRCGHPARHSVRHLDLESVPLGFDGVDVELRHQVAAVRPVPGGEVAHAETEHDGRVAVAVLRQGSAVPRPVRDLTARDVARPDHQVGALVDALEQTGGTSAGSWENLVSISTKTSKPRSSPPTGSPPDRHSPGRILQGG